MDCHNHLHGLTHIIAAYWRTHLQWNDSGLGLTSCNSLFLHHLEAFGLMEWWNNLWLTFGPESRQHLVRLGCCSFVLTSVVNTGYWIQDSGNTGVEMDVAYLTVILDNPLQEYFLPVPETLCLVSWFSCQERIFSLGNTENDPWPFRAVHATNQGQRIGCRYGPAWLILLPRRNQIIATKWGRHYVWSPWDLLDSHVQ